MLSGKAIIIHLVAGWTKKIFLYKKNYFSEPCTRTKKKVKVELYFSNYATKSNLKGQQLLIHENLKKKVDLASFKSHVDKLDNGKLETTPADLSKLHNVVKSDAVKKTVYNELV